LLWEFIVHKSLACIGRTMGIIIFIIIEIIIG
jgi:hypothetical protein